MAESWILPSAYLWEIRSRLLGSGRGFGEFMADDDHDTVIWVAVSKSAAMQALRPIILASVTPTSSMQPCRPATSPSAPRSLPIYGYRYGTRPATVSSIRDTPLPQRPGSGVHVAVGQGGVEDMEARGEAAVEASEDSRRWASDESAEGREEVVEEEMEVAEKEVGWAEDEVEVAVEEREVAEGEVEVAEEEIEVAEEEVEVAEEEVEVAEEEVEVAEEEAEAAKEETEVAVVVSADVNVEGYTSVASGAEDNAQAPTPTVGKNGMPFVIGELKCGNANRRRILKEKRRLEKEVVVASALARVDRRNGKRALPPLRLGVEGPRLKRRRLLEGQVRPVPVESSPGSETEDEVLPGDSNPEPGIRQVTRPNPRRLADSDSDTSALSSPPPSSTNSSDESPPPSSEVESKRACVNDEAEARALAYLQKAKYAADASPFIKQTDAQHTDQMAIKAAAIAGPEAWENLRRIIGFHRVQGSGEAMLSTPATAPRSQLREPLRRFCRTFTEVDADLVSALMGPIGMHIRLRQLYIDYVEADRDLHDGGQSDTANGTSRRKRSLFIALHPHYDKIAQPAKSKACRSDWNKFTRRLEEAARWWQIGERLGPGVIGLIPPSVKDTFVQKTLRKDQFLVWLEMIEAARPSCRQHGEQLWDRLLCMGNTSLGVRRLAPLPSRRFLLETVDLRNTKVLDLTHLLDEVDEGRTNLDELDTAWVDSIAIAAGVGFPSLGRVGFGTTQLEDFGTTQLGDFSTTRPEDFETLAGLDIADFEAMGDGQLC